MTEASKLLKPDCLLPSVSQRSQFNAAQPGWRDDLPRECQNLILTISQRNEGRSLQPLLIFPSSRNCN